jgi:hypothetical protein
LYQQLQAGHEEFSAEINHYRQRDTLHADRLEELARTNTALSRDLKTCREQITQLKSRETQATYAHDVSEGKWKAELVNSRNLKNIINMLQRRVEQERNNCEMFMNVAKQMSDKVTYHFNVWNARMKNIERQEKACQQPVDSKFKQLVEENVGHFTELAKAVHSIEEQATSVSQQVANNSQATSADATNTYAVHQESQQQDHNNDSLASAELSAPMPALPIIEVTEPATESESSSAQTDLERNQKTRSCNDDATQQVAAAEARQSQRQERVASAETSFLSPSTEHRKHVSADTRKGHREDTVMQANQIDEEAEEAEIDFGNIDADADVMMSKQANITFQGMCAYTCA